MKRILLVVLAVILVICAGCQAKPQENVLQISATFNLKEYDGDGNMLSDRTEVSRSYLVGFIDDLYVCMAQNASYQIPDITNTGNTAAANSALNTNGASGSVNQGIIVGTSTTAVALTDYKIGTIIANGTGSGQLSYGANSFTQPSTASTTRSFNIIRTFTNTSGGTITVNELAVYGLYASSKYCCLIRDLVSGGQAISNGHALTVTYTISISL